MYLFPGCSNTGVYLRATLVQDYRIAGNLAILQLGEGQSILNSQNPCRDNLARQTSKATTVKFKNVNVDLFTTHNDHQYFRLNVK